jgi:hypothetical protein
MAESGVELVHRNGEVVDFADGKPPEGELGSLDPRASRMFTDYETWAGLWERPSPRKLEEMLRRDGKAQALEQVLTLPLRWAPWSIEAHKDDTGEAEFVTEVLTTPPQDGGMSTPLDYVIAQASSAVYLRRAFFEKVFDTDGERVRYRKLAFRPAESCILRRDPKDGSFKGFTQRVAGRDEPVVIGPDKAFVYVHDQARSALTGRSALETAYRAYEAKQKVRFLWFTFLERHATPWAEGKVANTDPGEADALARKIASLKGGGVVGLLEGQEMDLHEPGSDGAAFKDCMDWLSAEMSVSVLASFTDLAQQGSGKGSYALSADQSDFFLRSRYAVLSELAAALTTYAISDLVRWNFPMGKTPTFKFGRLTPEAAEAVQTLWQALATQAQPNPRVPLEFLDLLTERVAEVLELDTDKVREAIQQRGTAVGNTPAEQLVGGISAAQQLVQEAGLGDAAPTGATA